MFWQTISDYPKYEVNIYGEIRNKKTKKVLKTHLDGDGYPRCCVWHKNKTKTLRVHRVVAMAFVPNPNNLPMVNHIDSDKANYDVDNLEWCTNQENLRKSTRIGRNKRMPLKGSFENMIQSWA